MQMGSNMDAEKPSCHIERRKVTNLIDESGGTSDVFGSLIAT